MVKVLCICCGCVVGIVGVLWVYCECVVGLSWVFVDVLLML